MINGQIFILMVNVFLFTFTKEKNAELHPTRHFSGIITGTEIPFTYT